MLCLEKKENILQRIKHMFTVYIYINSDIKYLIDTILIRFGFIYKHILLL